MCGMSFNRTNGAMAAKINRPAPIIVDDTAPDREVGPSANRATPRQSISVINAGVAMATAISSKVFFTAVGLRTTMIGKIASVR